MKYRYRFFIYVILVILAVIIAWLISGLIFAKKTFEMGYYGQITLNQCFTRQVNMPYYPDIYVLGTLIEQVIQCESGGRQYDSNGNLIIGKAGEIGICQFKQKTWDMFNKERGTNLDIMSREDQLEMIVWAFNKGEEYKRHWTCYQKLYNKEVDEI